MHNHGWLWIIFAWIAELYSIGNRYAVDYSGQTLEVFGWIRDNVGTAPDAIIVDITHYKKISRFWKECQGKLDHYSLVLS